MGLMRAKADRGAQHMHGDDEEVASVAAALVLVVIDLVGEVRDDHVVGTRRAGLTMDLPMARWRAAYTPSVISVISWLPHQEPII